MPAKLLAVAAYLIGVAGAGGFLAYVIGTGTDFWPRRRAIDGLEPWQLNLGLLFLFAIQHSGMARQTFKTKLAGLIPLFLQRSIYVGASGITLGAMTYYWQPLSGEPIWHGPIWIVAISLAAALGMSACCGSFDHAAFLGLTQAWTGNADIRAPLRIDGPYRFVRHPLMLGLFIAIWAQPIMPPELLMMNAGMTIYILGAIVLEEHDLVRQYGEEYEKYQRAVPSLIPWKWW
jgi:protein-S-isoprenylcysteine O-methyltransferase Ste14